MIKIIYNLFQLAAVPLELVSCKYEPKNISGHYESDQSEKRHLPVIITQAGDKAVVGDLKEVSSKDSISVGVFSSDESAFGQKQYLMTFSRGECLGVFDVDFEPQAEHQELLNLRVYGNKKCPDRTYSLMQTKSLSASSGPSH